MQLWKIIKNIFIPSSRVSNLQEKGQYFSRATFFSAQKCLVHAWQQLHIPKSSANQYRRDVLQYNELRNIYFNLQSNVHYIRENNKEEAHIASMAAVQKRQTIGNAVFIDQRFFTKIDLLQPAQDDSWEIIEFKYSHSIKRYYIYGMGYHDYLLKELGIHVSKHTVYILNTKYIMLDFPPDPEKIIKKVDLTAKVAKIQPEIKEIIVDLHSLAKQTTAPERIRAIDKSKFCRTPKNCNTLSTCWPNLCTNHIFTLREGGEKVQELFQAGINNIHEIPKDAELSEIQKIQAHAVTHNQEHIDNLKINEFLASLKFPYYFLDFETINPPLPVFLGSRPFQHIPIVFSLHVLPKQDGKLEHYQYINDGQADPRMEILEKLASTVQPGGSIICYNDVFERKCIQESVRYVDNYWQWYQATLNDFVDLSIPFRNLYYYHPAQMGSASLKTILPILTDTNYMDLSISDGHMANQSFLKMKLGKIAMEEQDRIKKDLLSYCAMDTYALYLIIEKLKVLAGD